MKVLLLLNLLVNLLTAKSIGLFCGPRVPDTYIALYLYTLLDKCASGSHEIEYENITATDG